MACGTPVIAIRGGSVPEVIDQGVTGFVVDDEAAAAAAAQHSLLLDRKQIRGVFEQRFTARRMAADYVRIYQRSHLLSGVQCLTAEGLWPPIACPGAAVIAATPPLATAAQAPSGQRCRARLRH